MLNPYKDVIIYQTQNYYSDLVNTLVSKRKLGKANDAGWRKAASIRQMLKALKYVPWLQEQADIDNANYILECLIQTAALNNIPTQSPLASIPIDGEGGYVPAPSIIIGNKGDKGDEGDTGPQGPTGLATDFSSIAVSVTTVADTFPIANATAARWDYTVISNIGAARSGSVIGVWNNTGSQIAYEDQSTEDIIGPTTGIEFTVQVFSGSIQLVATITSGTWSIRGSRYFIPNNGNGSGPISDVLQDGYVFIGNNLNVATARQLSGAITITNTGVASLGINTVTDVSVAAGANIAVTKLAPLTANRLVVTSSSGVLTATATPSLTEVNYLIGTTSSIQTQLNLKLTDPMLNIGDIIIRNASNNTVRLGIGSSNQVLTVVGGVPTWATPSASISGLTINRIPFASSSTTLTDDADLTFTSGNTLNVPNVNSPSNLTLTAGSGIVTVNASLLVNNGIKTDTGGTNEFLRTKILEIGDWNMDAISNVTVTHGLSLSKIRSAQALIWRDDGSAMYNLLTTGSGTVYVGTGGVGLGRQPGSIFDSTDYDRTSYNRGYIHITYAI